MNNILLRDSAKAQSKIARKSIKESTKDPLDGLAKVKDTRSMCRNPLCFYVPETNNPKRKLGKQFNL